MRGFKFYINLRNGETHTVRALTKEQAIEYARRILPNRLLDALRSNAIHLVMKVKQETGK